MIERRIMLVGMLAVTLLGAPDAGSADACFRGAACTVNGIGAQVCNAPPPGWSLDRIHKRLLTDPDLVRECASFGHEVHVFVVDTGIDASHPAFGSRVGTGTSMVAADPRTDPSGHGTAMAGIVGAAAVGDMVARGVAPSVRLHPVQVLECVSLNACGQGVTDTAKIVQGLEAIRDMVAKEGLRPAIALLALSGPRSDAVNEAVEDLIGRGITCVVAAGNDGLPPACFSPASASRAIVVGATDCCDRLLNTSNRGCGITLFAPGAAITVPVPGGGFVTVDLDTSGAAAHAAGVAALFLSVQPNATPRDVKQALIEVATPDVIAETAATLAGSPNLLLHAVPCVSRVVAERLMLDRFGGGRVDRLVERPELARPLRDFRGPKNPPGPVPE